MFGELIGLWMAAVWQQMGAPENVRAGRARSRPRHDDGRCAAGGKRSPEFYAAIVLHLVEISPKLQAAAAAAASRTSTCRYWWHTSLDEVPGGPSSSSPTNSSMRCRSTRRSSRPTAGTNASSTIDADGKLVIGTAPRAAAAFRCDAAARIAQCTGWLDLRMALGHDRPRDRPARAQRRRGADHRLRPRPAGSRRDLAGGRRAYLRRSAARAGRGRPHRARRFRGAGASRRNHRRAHPRTGVAARVSQAARHRQARRHAEGARAARQDRRDRRGARAADRRRAERHGRVVQGDRHRRSEVGALPGFAAAPADDDTRRSARAFRHPPRLLHPRRAACPAGSMQASTAASARTTTPANVAENRARMAAALGVAPRPSAHRLSRSIRRDVVSPKRLAAECAPARRRHRDPHARRSRSA